MRHDKVAHLIHNSANHPNLDHCKVELHFQYIMDGDNPDDFTVIPKSQFTMSRTVTKGGGGGYKLNGKTITHGDLRTFLKSKGVDLDQKRFLILQGEVEQIAQMKPKGQTEGETGLLEYLEDIIGTAHFKELIDVKQKDLEVANEARAQHLERVKAAEKEKAALEGKKKEAEDYLRSENELVRQKNRLYQVRKYDAQRLMDSLTQEITVIDEKLAAEKAKYKDIQLEMDQAEASYNKLAKEYEQLGHKANEAARELQKFEKEDIRLQENRKHLKNKGKKLIKSLETDKHTLVELESTINNCDADSNKFSVELDKLTETKVKEETELERIRDSMKGKTDEVQVQLEQKQRELAPWSAKINDKQAEIDLAQSEYDLLSDRVNSVQTKLDQAKTHRAALMESFEPKEAELGHYIKKRSKMVNQKKQIEETMVTALKDEEGLRTSAQGLRQRVDEARATKEADKSKGNIIKSLMRERDSGRLRGVHVRAF
jgi:structural maintenance of chromosome 4